MRPINFRCKKYLDNPQPLKSSLASTIQPTITPAFSHLEETPAVGAKRSPTSLKNGPPTSPPNSVNEKTPEMLIKKKKIQSDLPSTDVSCCSKCSPISSKTQAILEKLKSPKTMKQKACSEFKYTKEASAIIDETLNEIKANKAVLPNKLLTLTSESSHPIEKHSELISNEMELTLPLNYKTILNSLILLDDVICYFKLKRIPTTFESLSCSICTASRKGFSLSIFAQLHSIVPEFYTHNWTNMNNAMMLLIDIPREIENILQNIQPATPCLSYEYPAFPDNHPALQTIMPASVKQARIQILKERLLNATLYHYYQYIASSNITQEFDPLEQKVWPSQFHVHAVVPLPEATIKVKPAIITEKISEIIKKAPSAVPTNDKEDFMSIIRAKEQAMIKARTEAEQHLVEETEKKKACLQNTMIDSIKLVLKSRNKQTIELSEILPKLVNKERGHFESKAEVEDTIMELCLKKVLKIIVISGEKYLRLISNN